MGKRPTSMRISEQTKILLAKLTQRPGISQTAVIDLAIRHLAKQVGKL